MTVSNSAAVLAFCCVAIGSLGCKDKTPVPAPGSVDAATASLSSVSTPESAAADVAGAGTGKVSEPDAVSDVAQLSGVALGGAADVMVGGDAAALDGAASTDDANVADVDTLGDGDSDATGVDVHAHAALDGAVPGVARMRFPLKAFPPQDQERARKEARRGTRFSRKKRWGKAIGAFQKALTLDPNSWSRYDLAATYARAQLRGPALGMLKELRQWANSKFECFLCKVWLAKTRKDERFTTLHKDPAYKALVAGMNPKRPNYRQKTREFLASIEAGLRTMLKGTLEHQLSIAIHDKTRTVDAKTGEDSDWSERTVFFTKFEEVEQASLSKYDSPTKIRCRSGCCRLTYPEATLVPAKPPTLKPSKTLPKVGPKARSPKDGAPKAKAGKVSKDPMGTAKTPVSVPTEPCDFNRLDRICFWPFGPNDVAIVRLQQRLCEVKAMTTNDLIDRIGKDGWVVPKGATTPSGATPSPSGDTGRSDGNADPHAERPPGKPTILLPPEDL